MAEKEPFLLKNMFSPAFFEELETIIKKVLPEFDAPAFREKIFDRQWEERELKDRMKHTAFVLRDFLPEHFPEAVKVIVKIAQLKMREELGKDGFAYMFLPTFVEYFGLDHYEVSIEAMTEVTKLMSCEFAVRPFFLKYPEQMLGQTKAWANHSDFKVRRLASEGCRPRLPWGKGVPFLKEQPELIIPILDQLKDDPAEWVRRSVANNLNDISKDHPERVIALAEQWKGRSKEVDWVVKHACRTLLKQGHTRAMRLFGFGSIEDIEIVNFQLDRSEAKIGEELYFSFDVHNRSDQPLKVRLEYGVYFKKANGSLSRKVFQISEKEYPAKTSASIRKKQHFKIITTRKYYTGTHELGIIVNGQEVEKRPFELIS
jgi:3-methyladenine DNA glycosylase AlkC